jgi:Flp pilus assembly pilin Flp
VFGLPRGRSIACAWLQLFDGPQSLKPGADGKSVPGLSDSKDIHIPEKPVKMLSKLFRDLRTDEKGGAVMEYVMVAGMIIVVCIGLISVFGTKVLARWNSVNSAAL